MSTTQAVETDCVSTRRRGTNDGRPLQHLSAGQDLLIAREDALVAEDEIATGCHLLLQHGQKLTIFRHRPVCVLCVCARACAHEKGEEGRKSERGRTGVCFHLHVRNAMLAGVDERMPCISTLDPSL